MPETRKMTWLVTGGAGFFGLHMCQLIAQRNQKVISYDIERVPKHEKPEGLVEITADIRDQPKLRNALKGVDYVVHSAASFALSNPAEINAVNAEGTKVVLNACVEANVKRFVYISSTAVYGMPKHHPLSLDLILS